MFFFDWKISFLAISSFKISRKITEILWKFYQNIKTGNFKYFETAVLDFFLDEEIKF